MATKRHKTLFVKKVTPFKIREDIGYELEVHGTYEIPFEITSTEGAHDYVNCVNCQKQLSSYIDSLTKKYEGKMNVPAFPGCCERHTKLKELKEFRKADFDDVPRMTAFKIIITKQHIINNIIEDNWQKIIIDYIDWCIDSFGSMPNGYGEPLFLSEYLNSVTDYLLAETNIAAKKKTILLDYINSITKPVASKNVGFIALISIYKKSGLKNSLLAFLPTLET